MSHIGGGAGWRKSPSPDLVRGWVGQPPSLLYNGIFALRPASFPWRAARGTPVTSPADQRWRGACKGHLKRLGAAGKAATLGGCKSLEQPTRLRI